MDADTVVLSSKNGGKAAYSTSCDRNGNSIKFNNSGDSQEDFGSTFSELKEKQQSRQRRLIIIILITVVVGASVGAAVAAVVLTQTNRKGLVTGVTVTEPSRSALIDLISSTVDSAVDSKPTTTTSMVKNQEPVIGGSTHESDAALVDSFSPKESSVNCPVKYKGKCYRGLLGDGLNRTAARQLCQGIGWNLANVYSDNHFYLLEEYLRSFFNNDTDLESVADGYIMAWTGMTVTVENQDIFLSSGENVTYSELEIAECNSHDPSKNEFVQIELYETADELFYLQGLWQCDSTSSGNVALCEQS